MCCEENRRSGSLSAILTVWFSPALYQFAPRIVDALAIVVSIVRHWLRSRGRLGGLVICCGAMLQRV